MPSYSQRYTKDVSKIGRQDIRITMTMLYTGNNDDVPTFWFYGTEQKLMERVCRLLLKWTCGAVKRLVLSHCLVERPRNGYAREYHSIEVHGLNTDFMTDKSVALMFQRALLHECYCHVTQHPFARFINM